MIDGVEAFFAYARERHAVYLWRRAGKPRPWTTDSVLDRYRFTNVFRELDRTTIWFRENVRGPMSKEPSVLLATVLFRWFNRIATGEAMFQQEAVGLGDELPGETAWDATLRGGDVGNLRAAILSYCGKGPYVTGAYIIKTPDGMKKLDGVLWCVEQFMKEGQPFGMQLGKRPYKLGWRSLAEGLINAPGEVPLEEVWRWLIEFPFLGGFMAYEIVSDLRHTALLDQAPDIMTWANPGPGAARGAGRVLHGNKDYFNQHRDKAKLNLVMQQLLAASQEPIYWPEALHDEIQFDFSYVMGKPNESHRLGDVDPVLLIPSYWPRWEMREVEHTLCEYDKYQRAVLGEGRPRGTYK